MKPNFLESLLGANWRSTFFGGIMMCFLYIALNPDSIKGFMPEQFAKPIASFCTFVAGVVAFSKIKDAAVTGNGTKQAPSIVAQSDGSNKIIPPAVVLLIACILSAGCEVVRPSAIKGGGTYNPNGDFGVSGEIDFPLPSNGK